MAGSLRQNLRERTGSSGPLPFADFMQAALYHPSDGYYATRVPGREGALPDISVPHSLIRPPRRPGIPADVAGARPAFPRAAGC